MTQPKLLSIPFANIGEKNDIPDITAPQPQQATMETGFPQITQTLIAEGGVPPERADFNGILNIYGQHIVHLNKGLGYKFDSNFANKIGGYPLGATVVLDDGITEVQSVIAGNLANPNIDMQGWQKKKDVKASDVLLEDGSTQADFNRNRIKTLRDFGAKGDGVTDDTKAIQKAIDAGGLVFGVYGDTYLVTRQYEGTASTEIDAYCLIATSNSVIDLNGSTILRQKIGSGDSIKQYPITQCSGSNKLTIKNGTIDFNNQNTLGFIYSECTKSDQGLVNLKFINTVNTGTPRTSLPSNNSLVFIISCNDDVYVKNSSFFASNTPSFDNPSFGVRIITNKFSTIVDDPTVKPISNCYVENCKFYGAFTWQPIEIAGSKAFDCYMKNIFMYKPCLTAIDIDKGAVRCYAENIDIVAPQKGLQTVPTSTGGWEYIIARMQGYNDSNGDIYADNCWISNVNIYELPNNTAYYVANTSDKLGTLVAFSFAKNSTVSNVTVYGKGALYWLARVFGQQSLNNKIDNLNGGEYMIVNGDVDNTGNIEITNSNFGCYRGVVPTNTANFKFNFNHVYSSVVNYNKTPSYFLGTTANNTANIEIIGNTFTGFWRTFSLADNLSKNYKIKSNNMLNQSERSSISTISGSVDNIDDVIGSVYSYSGAYNIPAISSGATRSDNVTINGAMIGDMVSCSMSVPLQGMQQWCEVTAANTVTVYTRNDTALEVDLPTATIHIKRSAT